ncbi:MAG: histidine kinase, partial [Candidatus Electrothrix sp. AR1]|nr:histidine kinase [Candidatus Electrothrix sp. AR1]
LFDIIIGSDLLYEDEHVQLLSGFIENHVSPQCDVIIVDPGRGRKTKLSAKMSGYGFASSHVQPVHTDYLEQKFKGYILEFSRES